MNKQAECFLVGTSEKFQEENTQTLFCNILVSLADVVFETSQNWRNSKMLIGLAWPALCRCHWKLQGAWMYMFSEAVSEG